MDAWVISVGIKVGSRVRLVAGTPILNLKVGEVYTVNSINRFIPNVVCAYSFVEIRESNRFYSSDWFEEVK